MVTVGVLLLLTGGAFLVAAIWTLLADQFSPLAASSICAALFIGSGLVVLAVCNTLSEPRIPPLRQRVQEEADRVRPDPPSGEYPALMEAFLFGIATYERVRKQRR